ncbi:OmpL47-type beta-barrel domain-containing protein [Paenibacillus roseipurpureus]|uniref:Chitobiase/beta-hexosaminidase C-terminal domain-containing protein n=1 Tax=Paenibacillus roseopurpureus TaxID=2918901 RepID=A0AA96LT07_9BACL|nr:chitobiase/beta-hexosaminidase C-terminal domain-containing protein [Paenibacillus sp. MBLB1832]WNR45403.1 chitobiase/beta-hexosaminidase C-terminal domain-containing protein [Paenibacillus sp. MBLB1832]
MTVTLSALDDAAAPSVMVYSLDGGASWTVYVQPILIEQEGLTTVQFRSTDAAGNEEAVQTLEFKLDLTKPTVTYSVYDGTSTTIDKTIAITCQDVNTSAVSLGLGVHTFTASAVDIAGNSGSTTIHIQIKVTISSLVNFIQQTVTDNGIANSLIAKLNGAFEAEQQGNVNARDNKLNAFKHEVSAQSDKKLNVEQAQLLTTLADALMSQ